MSKTLFRKMVFETHPDQGGSAEKFREVMKNRSDYNALMMLAKKWNLKIDGIDNFETASEKLEAIVGALIKHAFTYKANQKSLYGVIIDIRKINKGYHKGANEFKVFDLESGIIWSLKTYEKQPFQEVIAIADLKDLKTGQEKDNQLKQYKKSVEQTKNQIADQHFYRLGLRKNKSYYGMGVDVLIQYKSGNQRWDQLCRTTAKSVYIVCNGYKNNERRIPISSIIRIKVVA